MHHSPRGLSFSAFFLMSAAVQAGIPLWSLSPNSSPQVHVNSAATATIQYTVTNNSKKARRLVLSNKTPKGISQASPCTLGPKGTGNSTCTLTLNINGSALPANTVSGGPILCQAFANGTPNLNQCYQPSSGDALTITRTGTLTVTPSTLGLSVNNPSLNAALTGRARHITIQNTGASKVTGLTITYPTWPGGAPATTATSNCNGTLAPGATCTITITPGSNPTSNCNTGIAPAISDTAITVNASNAAAPVTTNVAVLSYGCIYQGGFIYAVDDTTSNAGSIGGKVVSLVDQAAPNIGSPQPTSIIWSSNGSGSTLANGSLDIIPLITAFPTPNDSYIEAQQTFEGTYSNWPTFPFPAPSVFATCNGASDGKCNSGNILAFYNAYKTGYVVGGSSPYTLSAGPTNPAYYAAGLCTATIDSYSDWYLPAICEMDAVDVDITCPGIQSMRVNLPFLIGQFEAATPSTSCALGANCLAGEYWSSSEDTGSSQTLAYVELFDSSFANPFSNIKVDQNGVRCSRALTF